MVWKSFSVSTLLIVAAVVVAAAIPTALGAEESGWPREITVDDGTIVLYQPQMETFNGNELNARAAISFTETGTGAPVFGAVWIEARVSTDRDERMVHLVELEIPRVRFPDATKEQEQALIRLLEREMPTWDLSISLDRILAGLEVTESRRAAVEGLQNDAPKILVVDYPTVLVSIDGEPQLRKIEDSDLQYVINTPFTIVLEPKNKTYYLYAGSDAWYEATDIKGEWEVTSRVPSRVKDLMNPEDEVIVDEETDLTVPPEILIAMEPTEVISTDGAREYAPINTYLLYVSNTDADLLMEIESQKHFVLLSGRWFAASAIDGPWTYVPSDELPKAFSNIPRDSEMAHLRLWVAGTEEANEAIYDAMIPQTSAIKRDATAEVEYDGNPKFEDIQETELQYAVNSEKQVIKHGDKYYLAEEGVWYVASAPTGPWVVATEVPQEIYKQPASSPTYNTSYIYVYDSTPEVVYVGYYPGYTYSYIYHGAPVYGTGYYYRPYWGSYYYYPRPATWGFGVRYNPWYGWSFGLSYSTGRFTFSIGYGGWGRHYGGLWGPVGYRPYYRGYNRGWHNGYRAGARHGARAGYAAGRRDSVYRNQNIYNRKNNVARNAPSTRPATSNRPAATTARANNVYADKNGNVQRRSSDGSWQTRQGGDWKSSDAAAKARSQPSTRQGSSVSRTPSPSSMNRDYSARQRGSTRTQSYRGSTGGSRGGGAARRGGGGRRR